MARPAEDDSVKEIRIRAFSLLAGWAIGFLISWIAVTGSYHVGAIRAFYPGMTSFAPIGFIFSLLLWPVWLVPWAILRARPPSGLRSLVALLIPTILNYLLTMAGIFVLNEIWMTEPIY